MEMSSSSFGEYEPSHTTGDSEVYDHNSSLTQYDELTEHETPAISLDNYSTASYIDRNWNMNAKIDFEKLKLLNKVGEGAFSNVWETELFRTTFAYKQFKAKNPFNLDVYKEFRHEVDILKSLRHPNVVQFIGYTEKPFGVITEFMEQGSLALLLSDNTIILEGKHIFQVALQVAKGMHYLHSQSPPVFHRDLKSSNVLVQRIDQDQWTVKIGDFGLAMTQLHNHDVGLGAVDHRAPEAKPSHYTAKCDVFSYGMVLWSLFSRTEPWPETRDLSRWGEVVRGYISSGQRPPMPSYCSPFWKGLIEACWHQNGDARPTFAEILQSFEIEAPYQREQRSLWDVFVFEKMEEVGPKMESFVKTYIQTNIPPGLMYATTYTSVVDLKVQAEVINKFCTAAVSLASPFLHVMMGLANRKNGKCTAFFVYPDADHMARLHENYAKHIALISSFVGASTSPVTRHFYEVQTFFPGDPNRSKFAVVYNFSVKPDLKATEDLATIYDFKIVPRLQLNPNWCGSCLFTQRNEGKICLVVMFAGGDPNENVVDFLQNQLRLFKQSDGSTLLTSIPLIEHYDFGFQRVMLPNSNKTNENVEAGSPTRLRKIRKLPNFRRHANRDGGYHGD